MPVKNTKDLIPFVNELEIAIAKMNDSLKDWNDNKFNLMYAAERTQSIGASALSALVKADEALAEIGTASFHSAASRGKRLEDTLSKLRKEMYQIAGSATGSGTGGGELTSGLYYEELNNAIASVDPTIKSGLKLDYRLRELQHLAKSGGSVSQKNVHMPMKFAVEKPATASFQVPVQEGAVFVDGDVTVLSESGIPFLDAAGELISGTVSADGQVLLSAIPAQPYVLYFPVRMEIKDIPEDFLYLFMEQIVSKNSRAMGILLNFEDKIEGVLSDIEDMKGVNWTPDFSIMRNHQDLVKEGITPKGLNVEVVDGLAHVTFSYNDHPHLSHFILEAWDEDEKRYAPYDGEAGIVNK